MAGQHGQTSLGQRALTCVTYRVSDGRVVRYAEAAHCSRSHQPSTEPDVSSFNAKGRNSRVARKSWPGLGRERSLDALQVRHVHGQDRHVKSRTVYMYSKAGGHCGLRAPAAQCTCCCCCCFCRQVHHSSTSRHRRCSTTGVLAGVYLTDGCVHT